MNNDFESAIEAFREQGGLLRTRDILNLGIHPRTLYQMRDKGIVDQISRGVYRLASLPALSEPDLVVVATRVPRAIVCLISALALHDATGEVPHEVQIALPRGTKTPSLEYPPLRVFRFSGDALTGGIETVQHDEAEIKVYSLAKTVTDCFRFRNKIGIEVAIEALTEAVKRKGIQPREILHYARLNRIDRVILPYLEAIQ